MTKSPLVFLRKLLQQACQLVILTFAKIILRPLTRANIPPSLHNLISKKPCILVANHRRAVDPFAVCGNLPFKIILKILPIGFMTHNAFYDSPLRPVLWLMGCYPAKNPKNRHRLFGIEASVALINQGYSILIFPEGTRVRNKKRGQAHWGVIKIHQASPHTPIVLAHIEYHPGVKSRLQGRRRTVRYKLIQNPQFDNPESIMDEIFAL